MSIAVKPNSLLAPDEWPGCALGYEIVRNDRGGPALRVTARFDRAVVPAGKEVGLTAWLSIRRHANDPSLEIVTSCSLQGEGAVGDPTDAVRQYRALVEKLFRGVARGGDAPVTAVMTLPLHTASIAIRPDMLFPLTVALAVALRRQAERGDKPAIWERVRSPLTPWLPSSMAAAANSPPLVSWAQAAEAALVEYDGAGSRIRLARPVHEAKAVPDLWALRWGGPRGIAIVRRDMPPVAFAARPFAAALLTGSATVTAWDDALTPHTAPRSYGSIDVDAVFGRVVAILDQLAARGCTAALGRVEPTAPSRIEAARNTAAGAFARQLSPVLAAHDGVGVLAQAQHQMEQAARAGMADVASMWVQVGLAVSQPPVRMRLGGILSGVPSGPDVLALPADILLGPDASAWLDFPVSPPSDEDRATLSLRPGWTLTEIECLDDADDTRPTGQFAMVLTPAQTGAVDISLGDMDVPLASRLHPNSALPCDQEAVGPSDVAGQTLAELMAAATRWSFTLTIDRGRPQPQDDLWLELAFNRPLVRPLAGTDDAGTLTPLAIGLIRFETGYVSLDPPLAPSLAKGGPRADALAQIIAGLADDLADALGAPLATTAASLGVDEAITWVWRNRPNLDGSRSLFARVGPADAADEPCFPTVAGYAPQDRRPAPADRAPDVGAWREAVYHLPERAGDGPLAFRLDGLDLLSRQTVVARARVIRNPMGSGLNPLFARESGWGPFGPAVIPAIDLPTPLVVPTGDASLEQSLATALHPFCRAGDRTGGDERALRVEMIYTYPLTSTEGEPGPTASVPILSTSLRPDASTGPAEIAASLVERCRAWGQAVPLPRADAWLSLSAALTMDFAGASVPLLAVRRLDLPWPADWHLAMDRRG